MHILSAMSATRKMKILDSVDQKTGWMQEGLTRGQSLKVGGGSGGGAAGRYIYLARRGGGGRP